MYCTCAFTDDLDELYSREENELENSDRNGRQCMKEEIEEAAKFLKAKVDYHPRIGMICGSSLGYLADALENTIRISYSEIPNFPTCTVEGHEGTLIFGTLSEIPMMCMKGRFHLYEGYPLWKCTLPVRILQQFGIKLLILTNTSAGINRNYKAGDVVVIEDHIDLVRMFGHFSLRGPGEDLFRFRYSAVNRIYNKELIGRSLEIGAELGLNGDIHKGVYVFSTGPSIESVSDVRLLKVMGADVVGSSTVHEAVVAKDCGMEVFAFSSIKGMCNMEYDEEELSEDEDEPGEGKWSEDSMKKFVKQIVEHVNEKKFKGC